MQSDQTPKKLKARRYLWVLYTSLSSETGFCGTATRGPARRAIGHRPTPPPRPVAPGPARTARAPGRGRGACAPSRTSSLLCRSCIRSGAAGTPPVLSPNWWTASVLVFDVCLQRRNIRVTHEVRPVRLNLSLKVRVHGYRLRPVWLARGGRETAGRSSPTPTWRPRPTTAPSPTPPSAMLPTPWRSPHRGSGASTPSATCGALASPGPASACSLVQQTRWRPPASLTPRAPRRSPGPGPPPLPPPSVRRRAAKPERGASFRVRAITSASRCLPSPRRRTGSPWSPPSTWVRPRWTDWSGARTRGRSPPPETASTPPTRGLGPSGDRGGARRQGASFCSPRLSPLWRAMASRPSDGPQCCAVWPIGCRRRWRWWKEQRLLGKGGGRGAHCAFDSVKYVFVKSVIPTYPAASCWQLFVLNLFLFFIKLYADDDRSSAASSARALAASMLKKKKKGTHFCATTP